MATVNDALKQAGATITSSPELGLLDEKAKRARYAALKSKLGMSRLGVQGRPGKHYFWAPLEDRNELARLDSLGYSIVREPNAEAVLKGEEKALINANGLKSDGTYTLGDVILTECDDEVYEFIMLNNSERHEEMVSGSTRDFQTEAERLAVPTFEHIK